MAQSGIHAILGYNLKYIISNEKKLLPAIVFGSILPDIDIVIVAFSSIFYPIFYSMQLFQRTITHSFFTIVFIYLFFALISEFYNNKSLKTIGKGLLIGMLLHIILDTFLWFNEIQFLWPLPIPAFNIWKIWDIPKWMKNTILISEILCFYFYAWFLITKHLKYPNKQSWIITYLQLWKSFCGFSFIILLLLFYLNIPNLLIFYVIIYVPSIIAALWGTYMSNQVLELNKK
mgnify:CR=1 FL=1